MLTTEAGVPAPVAVPPPAALSRPTRCRHCLLDPHQVDAGPLVHRPASISGTVSLAEERLPDGGTGRSRTEHPHPAALSIPGGAGAGYPSGDAASFAAQETVRAWPGWRPPATDTPPAAVAVLAVPAPLEQAIRAGGRPAWIEVLDQHPVRALADIDRLLRPPAARMVRHRELVHAGDHTAGAAGYTEARWPADALTPQFAELAATVGFAAAIAALRPHARVELLWWGSWTPVSSTAMTARVWWLVDDGEPIAVVHDAVQPTPPARVTTPALVRVQACGVCGRHYTRLIRHVHTAHDIDDDTYRRRYGTLDTDTDTEATGRQKAANDAPPTGEATVSRPRPTRWLAESVRELRRGLHLSRPDFAHALGVSLQTVTNWEWGTSTPNRASRQLLDHLKAAHPPRPPTDDNGGDQDHTQAGPSSSRHDGDRPEPTATPTIRKGPR